MARHAKNVSAKNKSLNGYQPNRLSINNVKGVRRECRAFYSNFQFVQEGSQHHEAAEILGRLDKCHRRRCDVPIAAFAQGPEFIANP